VGGSRQFSQAFSGEVYEFYSVSPEYFGYIHVHVIIFQELYCECRYGKSVTRYSHCGGCRRISKDLKENAWKYVTETLHNRIT
jgi:hypothetical protein